MALVAEAAAAVLRSSFGFFVDVAESLDRALEAVAHSDGYSAILLDFNMPGTDGLSALKRLSAANGGRVAVFSGVTDAALVDHLQRAGAVAYIPKDTPMAAVGEIIKAIAGNKTGPVQGTGCASATPIRSPGTWRPRERKTLALLADGLDIDAVAATLGVPSAITQIDAEAICKRLSASTVADAVAIARRLGMI